MPKAVLFSLRHVLYDGNEIPVPKAIDRPSMSGMELNMAAEQNQPPGSQRSPGHLEQEENRLWRLALWFMVLLAVALAVLLWERLESSSLPPGRNRTRAADSGRSVRSVCLRPPA